MQKTLIGAHAAALEMKKSANDEGDNKNARQTRKRGAGVVSGDKKQQEDNAGTDPFAGNFELIGVGRKRLAQCNISELCAALKARSIPHKANVHINQSISKLEAWKRERALSKRNESFDVGKKGVCTGGDEDEGEEGGSEEENSESLKSMRTDARSSHTKRHGGKKGIEPEVFVNSAGTK